MFFIASKFLSNRSRSSMYKAIIISEFLFRKTELLLKSFLKFINIRIAQKVLFHILSDCFNLYSSLISLYTYLSKALSESNDKSSEIFI